MNILGFMFGFSFPNFGLGIQNNVENLITKVKGESMSVVRYVYQNKVVSAFMMLFNSPVE